MPAIITVRFMQDIDRGFERFRGSHIRTTTFANPDVCGSGRLVDVNGKALSIGG